MDLKRLWESIKSPLLLLGRTIALLPSARKSRRKILESMYSIGNQSLVFIALTLAFLGLILVYQASYQALKVLPDLTPVGPVFIGTMVRVFGPTVVALMLATRVGAGIAAETGSMTVTDQIEAMKVTNADPVEYLVVPRFIASIIMMIVLWVFGVLVAVAAGTLIGTLRFGIQLRTFLSLSGTTMSDVWVALFKCVIFGAAIPILAADSGFKATGGSEGVGWATTKAVVHSLFTVILLDFLISSIAYRFGW